MSSMLVLATAENYRAVDLGLPCLREGVGMSDLICQGWHVSAMQVNSVNSLYDTMDSHPPLCTQHLESSISGRESQTRGVTQ